MNNIKNFFVNFLAKLLPILEIYKLTSHSASSYWVIDVGFQKPIMKGDSLHFLF